MRDCALSAARVGHDVTAASARSAALTRSPGHGVGAKGVSPPCRRLVQRPPRRRDPRAVSSALRAGYLRRAPGLIATIAALLGVLSLVDAVWAAEREHVHMITRVLPVPASAAATAVAAVSGLLLLRLAAALRKRKRRAWRAAVVLTGVIVVAHLVRDRHPAEIVIPLVLLVLLVTARSRFTAKADPHSRWFALRVFLQFFFVAVVYGMAMLYVYSDHVVGHPSFWARLWEVVDLAGRRRRTDPGCTGERFDDVVARHAVRRSAWSRSSVVALLALRPSEPIARLSDRRRAAAARACSTSHGGRDSLGYFALRRDKSVVWSPTGKAAVTYRVVLGVALASGDPIGDPEAWPGAIAAYRDLVEEYGWTPAVMGASELGATVYKREMCLSTLRAG